MIRRLPLPLLAALLLVTSGYFAIRGVSRRAQASRQDETTANLGAEATPIPSKYYLGFDLNTYPGDDALPVLRKSFSFVGYWLSPPPGAQENTWAGKRELLRSRGFGFAVLYTGPLGKDLKSEAQARSRGTSDAKQAAATGKREEFPLRTIIFLDIEEGGRLSPAYHAYLREWVDELARAGYRAGTYCSGMPVSEGHGVTIVTSDDIRNNLEGREMAYWVFNDACPPSPGCALPHNIPAPAGSGVQYAAIWQMSRSPRRKEFTARCASTYQQDGNCYAPGDAVHKWFLDVNTATSADPSAAK